MKSFSISKILTYSIVIVFAVFLSSGIAFSNQEKLEINDHLTFREANTLFGENKDFQAALDIYLGLEKEQGLSAPLAFNIASCYSNLQELGKTRLYLEKARLIDPQDPDIENNLNVLLKRLKLEETTPSGLEEFANKLNSNQWFWIGSVFILLPAAAILIIRVTQAWQRQQRVFSLGTILLLSLSLTIGCGATYLSHYRAKLSYCGIVIKPNVSLRQSPFEHSEPIANVQEGRKLRIIKSHEDYFLCYDQASAIKAWVSKSDFSSIID